MSNFLIDKRKKGILRFFIWASPSGINIINMVMNSFYACRSQKHKKTVKSSVSFFPFVICTKKAAGKMLVKSTPGVDFTNILRAAFPRVDPKSAKKTYNLTVFLCFWDLCAQKLLVEC